MAFDPTKPANNSPIVSAELRGQFTSLKTLIDAIPAGPQGPPGEVTQAALDGAIAGTANNPNGNVPNLDPGWSPSGDTNADLIWLRDRLVDLYNATLR